MTQGSEGSSSESGDSRNQVVAVGTPLATVVGTQQGPVMVSDIDRAFFFNKDTRCSPPSFFSRYIETRILGMLNGNRNDHS